MKKKSEVIRKMGLLSFILLLFAAYSPQELSAKDGTISFTLRNATLKEIVNEIKQRSDYDFMYADVLLDSYKVKDVSFKNLSVEDILVECLKGSDIDWSINGKTIVLKRVVPQDKNFIVVEGVVTDVGGTPLPGVTVIIKGSTLGTSTNRTGSYRINVPEGSNVLVFSFVGMKTQEVAIGNRERIDIKLEDDAQELEGVVVTGYQQIDRRHLTSAISSVNAEDILFGGMNSIDQALEGQIPELQVMVNSGEVGATPRIRVRGTSTILGNREPLWVLDGFILQDPVDVSNDELNDPDYINIVGNAIAGINPQDIERIDVLKDASATALYGVRAANGVIVVTTRRGSVGRVTISYNHSSKLTRRPRYTDRNINLMNSQERVQFGKELSDLHYKFPSGMTMVGYEGALYRYYLGQTSFNEFEKEVSWYETVNTDWFDILTHDTYSHDHTLGVSGGNESIRYYVSLGYNYEDGTSKTTYTNRYSARTNLDMTFSDRFRANFTFSGNVQKKNHLIGQIDAMNYAYNTTRALPCYNEDGSLYYYDRVAYQTGRISNKFRYNILNEINNSSNSYDGNTINASLNLKYKIFSGLELTAAGNYSRSSTMQEQWWGEKSHYVARLKNGELESVPMPGDDGYSILPYGGILKTTNTIAKSYTFRLQADYRKTLGEDSRHLITATGGFEVYDNTSNVINDENRGYVKERGLQFIDQIDLEKYPHYASWLNVNHRDISHNINRQVSAYATASYSYRNIAAFSMNGRYDASNAFGNHSNNHLLPVWAVSVMWNIKENLLEEVNWLSDLRIRGSYGLQGTMLDDQSPKLIMRQGTINTMYNENESTVERLPNPDLKWEKTQQINLQLDAAFLDNRLAVYGTFYHKRTKDLFTTVQVSSINGVPGNNYVMNGGDVDNTGFSVQLNAIPIKIKDFQWRFSTYYSANYNKVKSGTVETYALSDYLNGTAVVDGEAISTFYSYQFKGLHPDNGTPVVVDYADRQHLLQDLSMEETVKMVMKNNGQRDPIMSGSFTNTLTYKRFTFTANMAYSLGGKVRMFPLFEPILSGVTSDANVRKEFTKRWRNPGDEKITNIPSIMSPGDPEYNGYLLHFSGAAASSTGVQQYGSSVWDMYDKSDVRVVSGSYLKCTSMALRYNFSSAMLKKTPFSNIQVSLNTLNPFTISAKKLKGQDPSQAGFSTPNLSVRPSYTLQFNVSF